MSETEKKFLENLTVRPMVREDIDDVMLIELSSFVSPWGRQHFLDELKNPDISVPLVVEYGKNIIAYAVLWIILDEGHLANIAVNPDYRNRGVAGFMIGYIRKVALAHDCTRVMLEVRKSNTGAMRLYERHHFYKVGVRKNYYHDGFMRTEDAILMDLDLTKEDSR